LPEKENSNTLSTRPPVPPFQSNEIEHPRLSSLPPFLDPVYQSITATLTTSFSKAPPHTLQRLSELLLHPRAHYRTLPTYLRAVERVISVSSPLSLFPLPSTTVSTDASSTLLNGVPSASNIALGSDESLGGALLTPIPWLREQQNEIRTESTETIDGPNGAGSIATVSVSVNGGNMTSAQQLAETMREAGAVTQGELLRQEQEAGVVLLTQTQSGRQTRSATARSAAASAAAGGRNEAEEGHDSKEETPHARGPEEVGMEDMGPQDESKVAGGAFDIEAATGRTVDGGDQKTTHTSKDHEGDIVLADVDGAGDGEDGADARRADASGINVGVDASDGTNA
jgi:hypothetical protein